MTGEPLTVDLQDRVDELDGDVATVRDELQSLEEEADGLVDEMEATDDAEEFEPLEDEYDQLEQDYAELQAYQQRLEGERNRLEECIEEWGGSEFEIRTLTWGDRNRIDDLVRAAAIEEGDEDGRAHQGKYMEAFVNVATTSTPPEAPSEASEYPPAAGQWLYGRADAFNSGAGEDDMGNSSLRQQVTPPESRPTSSTEDST